MHFASSNIGLALPAYCGIQLACVPSARTVDSGRSWRCSSAACVCSHLSDASSHVVLVCNDAVCKPLEFGIALAEVLVDVCVTVVGCFELLPCLPRALGGS